MNDLLRVFAGLRYRQDDAYQGNESSSVTRNTLSIHVKLAAKPLFANRAWPL